MVRLYASSTGRDGLTLTDFENLVRPPAAASLLLASALLSAAPAVPYSRSF